MILDSDILIEFLGKNPWAAAFLEDILRTERNISAIAYLEAMYGCRSKPELRNVHAFVTDALTEIIPVNEKVSHPAVELMERYVLSHRPDISDVLIAATALERGEPLASGNEDHFKFIPGLELKVFWPRI